MPFDFNYDGCIYRVELKNGFHYYYMKFKNAVEFLWDYYLSHEGKNHDEDWREHYRWCLDTTGWIECTGKIDEEYFEDFEKEFCSND